IVKINRKFIKKMEMQPIQSERFLKAIKESKTKTIDDITPILSDISSQSDNESNITNNTNNNYNNNNYNLNDINNKLNKYKFNILTYKTLIDKNLLYLNDCYNDSINDVDKYFN